MIGMTITLIVSIVVLVVMFYTMAQFVPLRVKYWKLPIFLVVPVLHFFIKEQLLRDGNLAVANALGLLFMGLMILFALWAYSGQIWKRLVVIIFLVMLSVVCDGLSVLLVKAIINRPMVYDYTSVDAIYGALFFGLLSIMLLGVTIWVSRTIKMRHFNPAFLLLPIFPFGQIALLGTFEGKYLTLGTLEVELFNHWLSYVGLALCFLSDIALLIILVEQDKKLVLQEELRETQHKMELEQSHYRDVEQRREELAKIRHDFNNQLASIGQLIHTGDDSSAQEMIHALSEEIFSTKENPYCGIPVINAILTEKARICTEAEITLTVDLDLPNLFSVEPMHLCSIFGNLLDNAINACKQVKHTDKLTIQINSMMDGDYLFIKAVNPSVEPTKELVAGRGHGSRILSDLAARYSGDFRMDYKDGVFTAVVSLLAVAGS